MTNQLSIKQEKANLIKRFRFEGRIMLDNILSDVLAEVGAAYDLALNRGVPYDGPVSPDDMLGFIISTFRKQHAIGPGE